MLRVWFSLLALGAASQAIAAGWNPKLAASYLDERQKQWFSWSVAARTGGPCVSCHTGVSYLIARPALRRVLGESEPTEWETGLRDALRARAGSKDAKAILKYETEPTATQAIGVESILAAVFLPDSTPARERLWELQKPGGEWNWFVLELDPWENNEAPYFGAALAALATQGAPPDRVAALRDYLLFNAPTQPLQNRLALLWTAKSLPGVAQRKWIDEAFAKQEKDGGWTTASMGPWKAREKAPPAAPGSNAYATAFAAFTLGEAGVPPADPRMVRALNWLRTHQDKTGGYWDAVSMNKPYPAGSRQEQFMREAATAYAAAALVKAEAGLR